MSSYYVEMIDAPDVPGSTTETYVGFIVKEFGTNKTLEDCRVGFGAFDDDDTAIPAANAIFMTDMREGTLCAPALAGTAAVEVKTSKKGMVVIRVKDLVDEKVRFRCVPTVGSPCLDCRQIDSVEFKP